MKRLVGLDLIRLFSVLMVFLFHTAIHLDCDYGPFQPFIMEGSMFMTTFFMLSGFVLTYTNTGKELSQFADVKKFYIKRFIGLIPVYWVVAAIFTILCLVRGTESLINTATLFPIETLGLQSFFCSLFDINHNGGTWFISCLIPCYLLFPFIIGLARQIPSKFRFLLTIMIMTLLVYSSIVVALQHLDSIYSNPLFRILEFTLGCLLCLEWQGGRFNKLSMRQLLIAGGAY